MRLTYVQRRSTESRPQTTPFRRGIYSDYMSVWSEVMAAALVILSFVEGSTRRFVRGSRNGGFRKDCTVQL
jgi:hypothetical protein